MTPPMPPHSRRARPISGVLALFAILAAGSTSLAQGTFGPGAKVPKGAQGAVPLADTPLKLDSVGLSMRVPVGASMESTMIGGRRTVQVIAEDGKWLFNVQTPQTTNFKTGIAQALDETLTLIQGSYGIVDPDQKEILTTQAQILEKEPDLTLPGGKAARLYVSLPASDGKSRVVKGYTIFKPGSNQFVVFELVTAEKEFSRSRTAYEAAVGTAAFTDSEQLNLQRGAAVKAGTAFMQGLSEADYVKAMDGPETWARLYKPATSGTPMDSQELGYRGVKFWQGQRGEINPSKAKSNFSKAEQQEGLLVSVRGRILVEGGVGDTLGIYFMTPDRNEETWTVRTVFKDKDGKVLAQASETGARIKDDVTVVKEESGRPATHVKPPIMGEGYISQFETFLLPRLIALKGIETELGFYAYQSAPSGTITFRRDAASREGGGGSTAHWKIVSTLREDLPPQETTLDPKGNLIRTSLDDGRVWEPVDLEQLRRMWQSKGLPVDK